MVVTLIGGFGWQDQNGTNQDQRLGGSKERKRAVGAIRVMQGEYVIGLLLQLLKGIVCVLFFHLAAILANESPSFSSEGTNQQEGTNGRENISQEKPARADQEMHDEARPK